MLQYKKTNTNLNVIKESVSCCVHIYILLSTYSAALRLYESE